MLESTDTERVNQERGLLLQIAHMYETLLGRPPDASGLSFYHEQARTGASIDDIATSLIQSDEFRRNAGGHGATRPGAQDSSLSGRASELDRDARGVDAVRKIFPDGIPIDYRFAYVWWLEAMESSRSSRHAAMPAAANPSPIVIFFVDLTETADAVADPTILSITAQRNPNWRLVVQGKSRRYLLALRKRVGNRLYCPDLWPRALRPWRLSLSFGSGRTDFVCPLRAGDRIEPSTVDELLERGRSADVILSDGGVIDRDGSPCRPALTGDWDPDAALVRPPDGLVCVAARLLRETCRVEDLAGEHGAWTMLLQASGSARPDRIAHIPAVLRHRRLSADAPLVESEAARRVVEASLSRTNTDGDVVRPVISPDCFRVIHPVPTPSPFVSIVVPTKDQPFLLERCMEGLLERTSYDRFEVIVVDNGSRGRATRDVIRRVAQDPRVSVVRDERPFNWPALNAAGVEAARGDVLVFLNDDVYVLEPDWLREMVSQAIRPDVGIVGAKLLYPNGSIQHAGIAFDGSAAWHAWRFAPSDQPGYGSQLAMVRTVSAVTGACMAMRSSVYREIGGFELTRLPVTWGDIDICLRARKAGYRTVWTPFAVLFHQEHSSRGSDTTPEKQARFCAEQDYIVSTWPGDVEQDRYFSPHLLPQKPVPVIRT